MATRALFIGGPDHLTERALPSPPPTEWRVPLFDNNVGVMMEEWRYDTELPRLKVGTYRRQHPIVDTFRQSILYEVYVYVDPN